MRHSWSDIAVVLAELDPMGITDGNPEPVEEYRGEAEAIAREVSAAGFNQKEIDSVALSAIVIAVFEEAFDHRLAPDISSKIAERLLPLLNPEP